MFLNEQCDVSLTLAKLVTMFYTFCHSLSDCMM